MNTLHAKQRLTQFANSSNFARELPELHQGLHFRGLLHTTACTIAQKEPSDEIIDSQSSSKNPFSSLIPPSGGSSARSTPPSANRRSLVTKQIYQFALGFPQTPPEDSPELSPLEQTLETSPSPGVGTMGTTGSFVFKWYVVFLAAQMVWGDHHYAPRTVAMCAWQCIAHSLSVAVCA